MLLRKSSSVSKFKRKFPTTIRSIFFSRNHQIPRLTRGRKAGKTFGCQNLQVSFFFYNRAVIYKTWSYSVHAVFSYHFYWYHSYFFYSFKVFFNSWGPLVSALHLLHLIILVFITLMGVGGGDMCQKATTNRVIVCFNCTQWIVTEVGSEVTVLPQMWTWPSLALTLQWYHSCHRLIVPPINRNYFWQ